MIPRNILLLRRQTWVCCSIIFGVWSILSIIIQKPILILSFLIGGLFSFLILNQLINSQSMIINTRNNSKFFVSFVARLALYGLPVTLTFLLKNYLNISVVLISLFTFQGTYLIWEIVLNLKRYKKRKKSWKT